MNTWNKNKRIIIKKQRKLWNSRKLKKKNDARNQETKEIDAR
jgi:hypothetical protein